MTEESAPTHKKLTEAQWTEAKVLYETGKMNKTALAEEYGISRQAIHSGLTNRGAVYGSKTKVVADATVEAIRDEADKRRDDIQAMKERQRQRVELIQGLAIRQITEQVRDSKPLADRKADMAVLKSAMAIVAVGRGELYHIFDLNRDPDSADKIPEFIVGEYTSEEINALNRERLGISDEDLDDIEAGLDKNLGDPLGDLLDGTE